MHSKTLRQLSNSSDQSAFIMFAWRWPLIRIANWYKTFFFPFGITALANSLFLVRLLFNTFRSENCNYNVLFTWSHSVAHALSYFLINTTNYHQLILAFNNLQNMKNIENQKGLGKFIKQYFPSFDYLFICF